MPLPLRPNRVQPIPEAAHTGRETVPELEPVPPAGLTAEPPAGYAFAQPQFADPTAGSPLPAPSQAAPEPPPWDEVEAEVLSPQAAPVYAQRPAQAAGFPAPVPTTTPAGPLMTARVPSSIAQVYSQPAGMEAVLTEMGFEGMDLGQGFGGFPSVTLKDDVFRTSDGENLGSQFYAVIHNSKAKYIVKSGPGEEAEFKYSYDKVNDSSGKPLAQTFAIWKAQGKLNGEPEIKAYLDVTAQMLNLQTRELGAVVLLQVPSTSIERFKSYLKTLLIGGMAPSSVVTQVYPAPKVTSVKHPFHPWAFKKWGTLESLGV